MTIATEIFPSLDNERYFGPATVLDCDQTGTYVRIQIENTQGCPVVWSRKTLSMKDTVSQGDEVLIGGDWNSGFFLIDILSKNPGGEQYAHSPRDMPGDLHTQDGASATIKRDISPQSPEIIQVFSRHQDLLFEFDPSSETSRVYIPSGDLEFVTQKGDIKLHSAQDIQIEGNQIQVQGRSGIRLAISQAIGQLGSAFTLNPHRMKFTSPEVNISGQRGWVFLDELRFAGSRLFAKTGSIRCLAQKIETSAQTIIERAENFYQTAKELCQLRAGRKRTIVEGTYHLKTKTSILKSDQDVKVKANKIHLG